MKLCTVAQQKPLYFWRATYVGLQRVLSHMCATALFGMQTCLLYGRSIEYSHTVVPRVCRHKLETLGDEIKEKFRGLEEEYR